MVAGRAALACAAVAGGAAIGALAGAGLWFVALALMLALPAFLVLHRQPLMVIPVWLVVSPLVSTTDGVGVRYVYWAVHRALPVAALAALAVSRVLGFRARPLPRLGWPEALMGGYIVVTLLSIGYTAPDARANAYLLYDTVVIPMCLYLVVRLSDPDHAEVRRLVPAVVVVLAVQVAIGLLSWNLPGVLPDEWVRKAGERTTGTLRSADVFGTTMAFCGLFLLHVGVWTRRRVGRAAAIALFLLATLMIFLSFSRASWLAGLLAATGALLVYRRQLGRVALFAAPVLLLVWASGVLTQQFDLAEYRLSSAQSEESALSRLPAAQAALRMLDREPVVGWGYQNFDVYSRPFQGQVGDLVGATKPHASHNLYLTTLAEQGITGFVLFVGPVVLWLLRTRAALPHLPRTGLLGRDFVFVLWLIVAAYHVTNNFSRMSVTTGLGLFWITLGLLAAVVERHRPRTRSGRPDQAGSARGGNGTNRAARSDVCGDAASSVVHVVGTYPLLTTTFIDREISALRRWGLDVRVVAARRPSPDVPLSDEQRELARGTSYLIPIAWRSLLAAHLRFLVTRPGTYIGTLAHLVTRPHPDVRARGKTVLHFGEGVYAAHVVDDGHVRELHAHFADRAATIALVASRLLRRPFSLSVHAGADVFVRPVLLREKLAAARRVVTCTAHTKAYLARLLADDLDRKVTVVPHGLDLSGYRPARPGTNGLPLVLAVGQLAERKGFAHLVAACDVLRSQGRRFECRIIGGGPQHADLEELIAERSLGDTVLLRGPLPHEAVVDHYRRATMVVLPCVQTAAGDVDGIPNVLVEAMALGVPVVSSDLPAIRELITDDVDGLLAPAGDVERLATAVRRLLDDPNLRLRLGASARRTVVERFDVERNVRALARTLWPGLVEAEQSFPSGRLA